MSTSKGFFSISVHPASQNELDALKTRSAADRSRAGTPKYVTMPFSGGDVAADWVTVDGALPDPVLLYISDATETLNSFAPRLSAACKLPILNVSYDAVAGKGSDQAVDNVVSVFQALQKAHIPAGQIVLIGRAKGAILALAALLRLAGTDGPLPRCAIAVSPGAGLDALDAPTPSSQLARACPLLVIAGDEAVNKDDGVEFAERAAAVGVQTTLTRYAGMPGDFELLDLSSSRDMFREIQSFAALHDGFSPQPATPLTIERVGWAGYVIVTEAGTKVLIDPYQCGSEGFHTGLPQSPIQPKDLFGVDVIAVTHAGFDHRGQSLEIFRGGNAILVCGPALYAEAVEEHAPLDRIAPMVSGFEVRYKDVTIKAVPARHESSMELHGKFRSDQPMSFVVTTAAGTRIFCGGDSSISEDFKTWGSLYSPDIAILGIGGLWVGPIYAVELPPRDAMLAAAWLGAGTVIPVHYAPGDPAPLQLRAEVESAGLAIDVAILDFGQTWTRLAKDKQRTLLQKAS